MKFRQNTTDAPNVALRNNPFAALISANNEKRKSRTDTSPHPNTTIQLRIATNEKENKAAQGSITQVQAEDVDDDSAHINKETDNMDVDKCDASKAPNVSNDIEDKHTHDENKTHCNTNINESKILASQTHTGPTPVQVAVQDFFNNKKQKHIQKELGRQKEKEAKKVTIAEPQEDDFTEASRTKEK